MPGPLIAAPTFFALVAGTFIGVGVATLIYETDLVDDIKQGIKEGVDAFLEKRRHRNGGRMVENSNNNALFSEKDAYPTPAGSSSSMSNPFDDTFDDLYHSPSPAALSANNRARQQLHFGSSSESEEEENKRTHLVRRRGQGKGSASGSGSRESLSGSAGSARLSKRFRAPVDEKVLLFSVDQTDDKTAESSTDNGATTPATSTTANTGSELSTTDSDSNFSDPVMVELTSEDDLSEAEASSSVATLRQAPMMN